MSAIVGRLQCRKRKLGRIKERSVELSRVHRRQRSYDGFADGIGASLKVRNFKGKDSRRKNLQQGDVQDGLRSSAVSRGDPYVICSPLSGSKTKQMKNWKGVKRKVEIFKKSFSVRKQINLGNQSKQNRLASLTSQSKTVTSSEWVCKGLRLLKLLKQELFNENNAKMDNYEDYQAYIKIMNDPENNCKVNTHGFKISSY